MAPHTRRLFDEACALPEAERFRLAERLLASLDGLADPADTPEAIAEAWAAEIDRRAREIDEGLVEPVPWDEVTRRLRQARESG